MAVKDDTIRFIHAMTDGNHGLARQKWLLTLEQIRSLPECSGAGPS